MVGIKAGNSAQYHALPQSLDKNVKAASQRNKKILQYGIIALVFVVVVYVTDPNKWLGDGAVDKQGSGSSFASSRAPTKPTSPNDNRFAKREMTDYHDLCIVGAGLSGAIIAERYANERGQTSLILERRDHIGGNCYDYIDEETGIRVSKYGAHLFHTYYERVWEYVQKWSDWTPYEHEVVALINDKHVPVPVNIDTVNALFDLNIKDSKEMDEWLAKEQVKPAHGGEPANSEEMAMSRVGKRLYELIFHPYTIKQWAKEPRELGPEVTARIPVRNNHDPRYFADPHQALPTNGYTAIFEKMFENPMLTIKTNTDYFEVKDSLNCGKLYYTGPIDRYFADQGLEKLEYRSLDFEREVVKNVDFFQPKGVVNHPNASRTYTRIVEYKHFLEQKSDHTILFYEHSKDDGEPYYPVPNPTNQDLFTKYKQMAEEEVSVSFVGRLANYKYFNMDQTIENALALFDKDTGTLDVVVEHTCDGSIHKVTDVVNSISPNNTYVYDTCDEEGQPDVPEGVIYEKLAGGKKAVEYHLQRKDVNWASQNLFLMDAPSSNVSVAEAETALDEISRQKEFVDFATLPFLGCQTSQCSRDFNIESGIEFYVTREAIQRYALTSKNVVDHKK
eukprot:CAMPEP_0194047776 /NCGR_PEP_ID=MMETSP0009_2-20130614/25484_1 /TAXON_ID=210454 /ORGANISM="Grammatophora oceanica, Strain CCMP 410" /LENGTH=617 /DNA_ID=CAMNT_0038693485 /DNA_START=102 /DNA_END=1955 /DNA_ORIENTATION=+